MVQKLSTNNFEEIEEFYEEECPIIKLPESILALKKAKTNNNQKLMKKVFDVQEEEQVRPKSPNRESEQSPISELMDDEDDCDFTEDGGCSGVKY